ncbi:unnamed protein product, partial [Brassica oleracea var. botrytis]
PNSQSEQTKIKIILGLPLFEAQSIWDQSDVDCLILVNFVV